MDLYVKPGFGIEGMQLETVPGEDEPKAIIYLEGQGGLKVKVHMAASEWRWLALCLYDKKREEDARLGIES
ncbi:hypothetical protein [Streptomyces sp. NPDC094144]|uniref:hypothetical protein n=1 Tax=Streptomyces sp. NPDC094144 TaxID=3366056 RepID=UPI00382082F5